MIEQLTDDQIGVTKPITDLVLGWLSAPKDRDRGVAAIRMVLDSREKKKEDEAAQEAGGVKTGIDQLHDGLMDGLGRRVSLEYCGVFWAWWLIRYLIAQAWGVEMDKAKLAKLACFVRYSPIVLKAGNGYEPAPAINVDWNYLGMTTGDIPCPIYELHGNGKPSAECMGVKLYHWHNTVIPARMGETMSERWKPAWLTDESNAEVRRILIREIGLERTKKELGAEVLDKWREYELIKIAAIEGLPYVCLSMTCPSTGDTHVIRMPPDMDTAENAVLRMNRGIHPDEFEEQV